MSRLYIGNGGQELYPDKRWYGTTAYWDARIGFVPKEGHIIIYEDAFEEQGDNGTVVYHPNIKIGDGNQYVQDLPFLGEYESRMLMERIRELHELIMEKQDKHYTYEWRERLSTVAVNHNLHKKPNVAVFDTAGNELFGDVAYVDDDNITLTFSEAVRGTAYLN